MSRTDTPPPAKQLGQLAKFFGNNGVLTWDTIQFFVDNKEAREHLRRAVGEIISPPRVRLVSSMLGLTDTTIQERHRIAAEFDLEAALEQLTEHQREFITIRFGLADGRIKTLEQSGQHLGVSRERARQMEAKIFAKMRRRYHEAKWQEERDQQHALSQA